MAPYYLHTVRGVPASPGVSCHISARPVCDHSLDLQPDWAMKGVTSVSKFHTKIGKQLIAMMTLMLAQLGNNHPLNSSYHSS